MILLIPSSVVSEISDLPSVRVNLDIAYSARSDGQPLDFFNCRIRQALGRSPIARNERFQVASSQRRATYRGAPSLASVDRGRGTGSAVTPRSGGLFFSSTETRQRTAPLGSLAAAASRSFKHTRDLLNANLRSRNVISLPLPSLKYNVRLAMVGVSLFDRIMSDLLVPAILSGAPIIGVVA